MLHKLFKMNKEMLVIEQLVSSGTLYHHILEFKELNKYSSNVIKHSFGSDTIIPHGKISDIYDHFDFSDESLKNVISEVLK